MGVGEIQTLPDLVIKYKELETIENQSEETGEVLSYEQYREKEIIGALIAGRVDEAAELRAAIELRINALDEALSKAYELQDRIEIAFFAAVKMSGTNKIEGLAFSARIQASKATVVIEDESKVSEAFKYVDVNIKRRLPFSDLSNRRFWTSVILGRGVTAEEFLNLSEADTKTVGESLSVGISKASLYEALKTGLVPGAGLVKSEHLRVSPGKKETQKAIQKG